MGINRGGVARKSHDIASLIDRRRRVPPLSSKVADVSYCTIFPKHGILGRLSSLGLVADARNAHDLTIIIDRRGGSIAVAGHQREFVDLVLWRSQSPHGWEKLENLVAWLVLAATRVVMNASLRPANRLTQVICSCRKNIVSTRKIG